MAVFVLSMGTAKGQVFILGDASYPSVGVMIHFQTMDVPELGFYNYGLYGDKRTPGFENKTVTLAAGLTYYWSRFDDPQDCLRVYGGFNYNVWWLDDELLYPGKTISFDLGVSKTLGRFTLLIMADPLNVVVKPGFSIYF